MQTFCHSCLMPLGGPGEEHLESSYCQYCCDQEGNLKSREEVQAGIAGWLAGIKPGEASADYHQRAAFYMQAMPAWAEK